ncbi:MAG: hypothetical protein OEZ13_13905, partial [Spirochaetia bacterium]|nr:hypothetical protein [Spirochaetia bacterium]
ELVLGKVNVTFDEKPKENVIETSFSYLKQRLGSINLSDKEIQDIFESLNFKCETKDVNLTVTVPSYRSQFDLTIPDDLVEEIGRIAGYQNVEPLPFMVSCEVPQDKNEFRKLEHRLRKILSDAYQFMEVYNYAFQSEDDIELDRRYAKEPIRMQNSIAADLNCMRISPLTGLLKNVKKNQKEHDSLRFFELERIFVPKDLNNKEGGEESLPDERHFLSAVWAENEITNEKLVSFASMASDLVFRCGVHYNEQLPERIKEEIFHAGRAGQIKSLKDGKVLLKWGEINPRLLKKAGVKKRVLYFETFVGDLHKSQDGKSHYKRVPKFPAADFECTILTDIKEDFINIANTAGRPDPSKKEGDNTYVENLEYLTEYSGDPIPAGQKAVSLRVTWRNAEKTISHDELKNLQEDLVNRLSGAGYKLRS